MPCKEIFLQQSKTWQKSVLPDNIKNKISIEAGSKLGWREIVGDQGFILSIDDFGISAPGDVVLAKFGFTVENICKIVKHRLKENIQG